MLSPFPDTTPTPTWKPLSHPLSPCFYEGVPPNTHPLPPPWPAIPLHWAIEPSQDQGSPFPLMPR
ncbi:mCG148278 [Mus musculus]|nr:mCG148278 [Mus musculus]